MECVWMCVCGYVCVWICVSVDVCVWMCVCVWICVCVECVECVVCGVWCVWGGHRAPHPPPLCPPPPHHPATAPPLTRRIPVAQAKQKEAKEAGYSSVAEMEKVGLDPSTAAPPSAPPIPSRTPPSLP